MLSIILISLMMILAIGLLSFAEWFIDDRANQQMLRNRARQDAKYARTLLKGTRL